MKIKGIISAALAGMALLSLAACGPEEVPEVTPRLEADGALTHQETLLGAGESPVMELDFLLPQVRCEGDPAAAEAVNGYYRSVLDLQISVAKGYLPEAEAAMQSEFPRSYYFGTDSILCRSDETLISFFREERQYTGGAHDSLTAQAETFDAVTGQQVTLGDLFAVPAAEYTDRLLTEVARQIAEEPELYYPEEDPGQNARDLFSEANFYLTETGLVLFYQTYELAPYAFGLPQFEIPYQELEDIWGYGQGAEEE